METMSLSLSKLSPKLTIIYGRKTESMSEYKAIKIQLLSISTPLNILYFWTFFLCNMLQKAIPNGNNAHK